jgi:hypothetical protein
MEGHLISAYKVKQLMLFIPCVIDFNLNMFHVGTFLKMGKYSILIQTKEV